MRTRATRTVVWALALSLVIAACAPDETDDAAPPETNDEAEATPTDDPVELNVLVEAGGLQLQAEIAELFEQETGHTVTFIEVPYDGVFDRLTTEMAGGSSAIDVATVDVVWLPTFADFAEPLDDLFTDEVIDDLFPALVDDAQFNGTFVGMPQWTNTEITFYRQDLLDDPDEQAAFEAEYGYELTAPTTWDEFADMAEFFTREEMFGTDVKGSVETEWLAHVLQAGAPAVIIDDDGSVIVDSDEHLEALEFYTGLHCGQAVSPPGVSQIGWAEAQNYFYQGQTALLRFWAHAYRLTPDDSVVEGNVGVAPMLEGPAGVAGIPGPWYNIVPSTSENLEVAKEFVAFAYEHNHLGIEAPLGLAARISAFERYADQEGFEHFEPMIETLSAEQTRGRPMVENWQEIVDEVLIPMLQRALSCDADLEELLSNAASQIDDMQ